MKYELKHLIGKFYRSTITGDTWKIVNVDEKIGTISLTMKGDKGIQININSSELTKDFWEFVGSCS